MCRAFDWENDDRLRRMLSNNHAQVEVAELSLEEARTVLGGALHCRAVLSSANWNSYASIKPFSPSWMQFRPDHNADVSHGEGTPLIGTGTPQTAGRGCACGTIAGSVGEVINLLSDEIARTQQLCSAREA